MGRIDADRLIEDLHTLRSFGASGTGVVRTAFSDVDLQARRWIADRMADAGLDPAIDGIGNVYGRSQNQGPAVLLGSHSDTQPEGGWLDGAMGVMHAIEVARALRDDSATAHLAIDAVSWADEEGTYGSFLGSRSFVDELTLDDYDQTSAFGETVVQALDRLGLADRQRIQLDPSRHVAYIESHIEQGPHLEEAGHLIGAVTTIVGIRTMHITFAGQQNHAGTTPMHLRRDAASAMFRWCAALHDGMAAVAGPTSVWTIGSVAVEPGSPSIVPGRATAALQFRDGAETILDRMTNFVQELVDEHDNPNGVRVQSDGPHNPVAAAPMSPPIVEHVSAAAQHLAPDAWTAMPSMAGHDAQILARHLPSGMVFIPSIGGVSHDFAEDSRPEDIVLGAEVLAESCVRVLGDFEPS